MRTKKYIESQERGIRESLATIDSLQQQLNELAQQVRVQQQQQKAQETANKELKQWLNQGKKLLKDCAGVFPKEFLNDIQEEVNDICAEIDSEFDNLSQTDRFLNDETQREQDESEVPTSLTLVVGANEELPDVDDDETILSEKQLVSILQPLEPSLITALKTLFNISAKKKKISTIAKDLVMKRLTRKRIETLLINIENQVKLLSGIPEVA